jgi:hypothetical protein
VHALAAFVVFARFAAAASVAFAGVAFAAFVVFAGFAGATAPTVSPVRATAVQAEFATHYAVTAEDPSGKSLTYQWRLIPPTADPGCNHLSATGATAVWHHGDQDGCNHNVQAAQGHPGTVIVVVSDGEFSCTATYFGTNTGSGTAPQCVALTLASPAATAAPTIAPALASSGFPLWQIVVGILVFVGVAGGVGWFLLARRGQ